MSREIYDTQGTIRNPLEKKNAMCRQVRMALSADTVISKENMRPSALQQRNLQVGQGFQEPLQSQAFQGVPAKQDERLYTLFIFLLVCRLIDHWVL